MLFNKTYKHVEWLFPRKVNYYADQKSCTVLEKYLLPAYFFMNIFLQKIYAYFFLNFLARNSFGFSYEIYLAGKNCRSETFSTSNSCRFFHVKLF